MKSLIYKKTSPLLSLFLVTLFLFQSLEASEYTKTFDSKTNQNRDFQSRLQKYKEKNEKLDIYQRLFKYYGISTLTSSEPQTELAQNILKSLRFILINQKQEVDIAQLFSNRSENQIKVSIEKISEVKNDFIKVKILIQFSTPYGYDKAVETELFMFENDDFYPLYTPEKTKYFEQVGKFNI